MSLAQQTVGQTIVANMAPTPPEFAPFARLPAHIQRKVWEFALNLLVPKIVGRISNVSESYSLLDGITPDKLKPDILVNTRGRFDVFIQRSLHNAMRHDGKYHHINLGILFYTCHMSRDVGLTFWKEQVEGHMIVRVDHGLASRGNDINVDLAHDWKEDILLATKWKLLVVLEELLMLGRGQIPRTGGPRTVFPPVSERHGTLGAWHWDRKPTRNDEHWQ